MAGFSAAALVSLSSMANSTVPRTFLYTSTDARATVITADYFLPQYHMFQASDIIYVYNGSVLYTLVVVAASVTTVTVQDQTAQELTASAAITPGVSSIELNHATVAVVTTIASSVNHAGLFVIKNTSASGTAAHTVTLTAGTFNAANNNVATLNAPDEFLAVWFDSAGNGEVLVNYGTVGLA